MNPPSWSKVRFIHHEGHHLYGFIISKKLHHHFFSLWLPEMGLLIGEKSPTEKVYVPCVDAERRQSGAFFPFRLKKPWLDVFSCRFCAKVAWWLHHLRRGFLNAVKGGNY